jgi:NTE family protein
MPFKYNQFRHLVCSGAGIKGIAFIGVIHILDDHHLLDNIETYTGTSSGAILCAFLNLGYTHQELKQILFGINLQDFSDLDIIKIFEAWGIDKGAKVLSLIRAIIKYKTGSSDFTFKELHNKTNKKLTIMGSCLNNCQPYCFNYETYPNMPIAIALRISMCFPLYYCPVEFEGKLFVDGGLFAPYPIEYIFANNNSENNHEIANIAKYNEESTVGILTYNGNNIDKLDNETSNFGEFINTLLRCIGHNISRLNMRGYEKQTIIIKLHEFHAMNFSLTLDEKNYIYESGMKSAYEYLNMYFNKQRAYYLQQKYGTIWKKRVMRQKNAVI